ncbi:MAG: MFS transporter [Gammaproteobacteria bacterium]|nr:MFS transporter [Gammaproteobacteria bacterium]
MNETTSSFGGGKYLLAGGVAIFAIGQSLLFIIVAPMARSVGLTELQFGATFGLANLALIFASPFWGKKSDSIGRKPVFIIGLFGSAFGTLLMAITLRMGLAQSLSVSGMIAMLFMSRAIYGATASSIYPSASAYIADVTSWKDRGKGMALIGGANSFGSILGPALGGGLAFLGVLFPMYIAIVLSLVAAFAAIAWLKEPTRHASQKKAKKTSTLKFTDKRLRPYLIMWASFFIIFISMNFVTSFFIQDKLGITEMAGIMRTASLALASMALVITLVQGVLFQIIHVPPRLLLRLCAPVYAMGLFTVAVATSVMTLLIGFAVLGIAFSFATPGINACASQSVKSHEQGAAAGYLAAANTSGAILGPIFGTGIYKIAPTAPMIVGGIAMLLLGAFALMIPPPQQQD